MAAFLEYIAELHRAVHAVGLLLDARLAGELSQPEALVIVHLASGSPATINEVHRAFLHRRSTLTGVLDRLEAKGLVRRKTAPDDRRSVVLELTARGQRAAAQIAAALDELRGAESVPAIGERDVTRVRRVAEAASRLAATAQR